MNQVVPFRPEEAGAMPANVEIEMGLLAALLGRNELMDRIPSLRAEHFAEPRNAEIFGAMRALLAEGGAATPPLLKDYLAGRGALAEVGGTGYLAALFEYGMPGAAITDYARTIKDRYDRRCVIRQAEALIAAARDISLDRSFSDDIAGFIAGLDDVGIEGKARVVLRRDVLRNVVHRMQAPQPCHSTGLPALDSVLEGGIYQGRAYGIAARMKVGKTSLLATIAHALDRAGIPHLFACLEASPEEIEHKRAAFDLEFNSRAFYRSDTRDDPAFQRRIAEYLEHTCSNTLYAAMPGATFADLRAEVNSAVRRHGVRAVLVDYLQLVGGQRKGQSRSEHFDEVAQWSADTARRRNLAFVVAAQVNQENGNIRGGEGLRLACDMTLELKLTDSNYGWLEMWESRYTPRQNVGSENSPPIMLATARGPLFMEAP